MKPNQEYQSRDLDIDLNDNILDTIFGRIRSIEEKMELLVLKVDQLNTAFIKNDLGTPDYDGHRKEHIKGHISLEKTRTALEGYKEASTKQLINIIISGVVILLIGGAIQWIKTAAGK